MVLFASIKLNLGHLPMPITRLSYHICDFLEDSNGRLYILEFGNAAYRSSFEGRRKNNGIDVGQLIQKHAQSLGKVESDYTRLRDQLHARARMRMLDDMDLSEFKLEEAQTSRPKIKIVEGESRSDYHMESIQELAAARHWDKSKETAIVFDGANDMLFLFDRDKRILNSWLKLIGLGELQPRTWYYDCTATNTPFQMPEGIDYFVIKQSNGSLADGMILVPKADLNIVLNAIAHKDVALIPSDKVERYREGVAHYCRATEHQHLVIQEMCVSKKIERSDGNHAQHHAAGRAVFAVIEEDSKVRVEMIDLFWQLAIEPADDKNPTQASVISAKSRQNPHFNCWPSLSIKDQPQLIDVLTRIMTAAYQMDARDYLLKLYSNHQDEDVEYYLKRFSHIRINRLDQDLIAALRSAHGELAQSFLIDQAKYYLLPHHLQFTSDEIPLQQWLLAQITDLQPQLRVALLDFITKELSNMQSLNIKPEGTFFFDQYQLFERELKKTPADKNPKALVKPEETNFESKEAKQALQRRLRWGQVSAAYPFLGRKVIDLVSDYADEEDRDSTLALVR